jgi:predicted nuclease of predicted toxin-antitoxin system
VLGRPPGLLLVATGNLGNTDLLRLIERNWEAIEREFRSHRFVELGRDSLVVRD